MPSAPLWTLSCTCHVVPALEWGCEDRSTARSSSVSPPHLPKGCAWLPCSAPAGNCSCVLGDPKQHSSQATSFHGANPGCLFNSCSSVRTQSVTWLVPPQPPRHLPQRTHRFILYVLRRSVFFIAQVCNVYLRSPTSSLPAP